MVADHHFLLVTFPAQGHINPALQFAKRLIRMGVHVTLVTSVAMYRRMTKKTTINGLSFATFSDGYDDGFSTARDGSIEFYISELKRRCSEFVTKLIVSRSEEGNPFTCLVYTLSLSWAAEVARGLHLPIALLWIQPATVLDFYYYYFNTDYGDYIKEKMKQPSCSIELPGLPSLTAQDLPSFVLPSNMYPFGLQTFQEQLQVLGKEINPKVLVNTFEELEPDALRVIDKLHKVPIGPLIPSAFLDKIDPRDTSFGGDLFHGSDSYIEWLDSKPELSVVYVSFGSLSVLPKKQMEEIACALLESGHPFLWVIREKEKKGGDQEDEEEEEEEELSCRKEMEEKGKIVKWCSQVEVLSHPSLGCFVTHCGWNSSMESLASGVPVLAFPQWADQPTNAKLIEDVWKTGVRAKEEEGIVKSEEIRRCLEVIMGSGEKGEEMRRNAKKWKVLAREAVKEEGSSDKNLKAFVDGMRLEWPLLN